MGLPEREGYTHMKVSKRSLSAVVVFLLVATSAFAGKKTALSAPVVSCATGGSGATVQLAVTGGATGAPAGFSVHWLLLSEYQQYGWSGRGNSYCEASFSGNANGNYYSLSPGETVKIEIGKPFTIAGASSRCNGTALKCNEQYAFRVFAHANTVQNRSAWSETTFCSTMSCAGTGGGGPGGPGDNEPYAGCTQTAAYYSITGPSVESGLWPVDGLMLGNLFYTDVELEAILNSPSNGMGLTELAIQLIGAKLNVVTGASGGGINAKIAAADSLIGNIDVRTGTISDSLTSSHTAALLAFNQGATGPGSCE